MRSMRSRPITWINRGSPDCKGNTVTTRDPDGVTLRITCAECPVEWTMPARTPRT